MDDVARMAAQDRAALFTVTGTDRGLTTEMIEKDFWVCWALKRLFTLPDPPAGLLFKGGTSLSKVFNVIERFSEDVDLSFDRAGLGFGGTHDPGNLTGKKRKKSLKLLADVCQQVVQEKLLSQLIEVFREALKARKSTIWDLTLDDIDPDGQTILFHYPTSISPFGKNDQAYVRPIIRLEFGARSDHWPKIEAPISPYAANDHPKYFKEPTCNIHVLHAERTFWEKVTILHMWYHATAEKPFPDRQSRHYYDVAQLYQHELGKAAVKNTALLQDVAQHKEAFFQSSWARYDEAKPGTLRIVPPVPRLAELKQDYRKMQSMIFGKLPEFEYLIDVLHEVEQQINNPENG